MFRDRYTRLMSNGGGISPNDICRKRTRRTFDVIEIRSEHFAKMRKYIHKGQQSQAIALLASESFPIKEKLHFAVVAVASGAQDVINVLLDDPDIDASILGTRLYEVGGSEIMRFLLSDPRIDCSAHLRGWFIQAVQRGWVEAIGFLQQEDYIDPSMEENVAILLAARRNNIDTLQVLLSDERVDPSANNNKAFIRALKLGHDDFAKMLLEDERFEATSSVHEHAVRNDQLEIAKLIRRKLSAEDNATMERWFIVKNGKNKPI